MLIGPLLQRFDGQVWVVDWDRPGAIERFEAEEREWWSQNEPKEYGRFNDDEF